AVLDLHGQAWRRLGQDVVEVVAIDRNELAFLERLQGFLGLPGQIGHDADDQGQLGLDHSAVGFDLVSDLYARPSDAVEFFLQTFASHKRSPAKEKDKDSRDSGAKRRRFPSEES